MKKAFRKFKIAGERHSFLKYCIVSNVRFVCFVLFGEGGWFFCRYPFVMHNSSSKNVNRQGIFRISKFIQNKKAPHICKQTGEGVLCFLSYF